MNLEKTKQSLEKNGYKVCICKTLKEADHYLNKILDGTTIGIGGSITLEEMGAYQSLSAHNEVFWHWHLLDGMSLEEMRKKASDTAVYLTSANALSEDGEIINIDGSGNRLASTLYGHEKVIFVISADKIAPDLHQAIDRARNIASPLNAKRLNRKTPCAIKGDHCYDCKSEERICNAMVIHYRKMYSCEMEVILVEEKAGF